MSQNHFAEVGKYLSMMILKSRSPSSMKNSRISATGVVWSPMLIESVMSGSIVKEVTVWTSRVMETGFEHPLSIQRTLLSPLSQEWAMALVPKANKNHQPIFDDSPATTHSGGASIVTEQLNNPGCPNSGEELLSPMLPKINALNEEINSIPKPPTAHNYPIDHDMQLNGNDSDITNIEIGGNIFDVTAQNLMTPTHAELNGVIIGGIMQSVPPSHTELKGEYLCPINANQNSSTSDPHVLRKWKRLECGSHAQDVCPNTQDSTKNKRNRDEGDRTSRTYLAKKCKFQWWKVNKSQWWRLRDSPTKANEYYSVELSWTWVPTCREGAQSFDSGKRSLCRVFSRNVGR